MNVELTCEQCGCKFQRRKGEANRNAKLGRRVFCNASCQGKVLVKENIPEEFLHGNPQYLIADNRRDNYTPFKWYMKVVNQRSKEIDIDLEYLASVWDSQNGICPFTGWQLVLREHNKQNKLTIRHASLDRIDSNKGYVKGNIRFVSVMANYARNTFSDEELLEFCKAVANK